MERLHQLKKVIPVFAFLVGLHAGAAADYCSLVVRVLSPDQRRPLEVLVSVRENSGRVIEKETTLEDVKFCDLGILPVAVTVGRDTCNQTVVRDVPLTWQEQYLLTITYDPEPCMPERPPVPVPTCQELFRVGDQTGNWLAGASIRFEGPKFAARSTDNAGRALFVLKSGERVEGSISAAGHQTKQFSVSCSRSEPIREELIRLEKNSGR